MTDELPSSPADHVGLDVLADNDEGLLPPAEAARVDGHLAGCLPCREQQARLRATRAVLAALPPEPMPPEVTTRLEAALAAAEPGSTVLPFGTTSSRRGWLSRPAAAGLAATAAAVALVAAVVVGTTKHSDDDNPTVTSPLAGAGSADQATTAPDSFPITSSGRTYTSANAHELVTALARAGSGGTGSAEAAPQTALPQSLQTMHNSPEALLRCVAALTAGSTPVLPLAVDFGRYTDRTRKLRKKPAVVVVLPGPSGKADGWIVGPDCATAPDNNLYLFERVPAG